MAHRVRTRTLGRQTGHRLAMIRNLATALFEHKQIETTEMRAKETSRYVERIIELAKNAEKHKGDANKKDLAYKRQVFPRLYSRVDKDNPQSAARERAAARELFENVVKRYLATGGKAERKGGYTRITRLANRKGDGALMVLLSLVD